jgi:8-oxo-dGTP diphosphatase
MNKRFKLLPVVVILLKRPDGKILIQRRQNTGYMDGSLLPPAGHLDGGEPASTAAIREAKEELDIDIDPNDLIFKHIKHKPKLQDGDQEYLGLFFECRKWQGEIKINEPEKCSEQLWLTPTEYINHPDSIPHVAKTIELIKAGQVYSERA